MVEKENDSHAFNKERNKSRSYKDEVDHNKIKEKGKKNKKNDKESFENKVIKEEKKLVYRPKNS